MAKAQKGGVKAFLKKFKKETLTIVEKTIKKEEEKKKIFIAIMNDFTFPKSGEQAAAFTKDTKDFNARLYKNLKVL